MILLTALSLILASAIQDQEVFLEGHAHPPIAKNHKHDPEPAKCANRCSTLVGPKCCHPVYCAPCAGKLGLCAVCGKVRPVKRPVGLRGTLTRGEGETPSWSLSVEGTKHSLPVEAQGETPEKLSGTRVLVVGILKTGFEKGKPKKTLHARRIHPLGPAEQDLIVQVTVELSAEVKNCSGFLRLALVESKPHVVAKEAPLIHWIRPVEPNVEIELRIARRQKSRPEANFILMAFVDRSRSFDITWDRELIPPLTKLPEDTYHLSKYRDGAWREPPGKVISSPKKLTLKIGSRK